MMADSWHVALHSDWRGAQQLERGLRSMNCEIVCCVVGCTKDSSELHHVSKHASTAHTAALALRVSQMVLTIRKPFIRVHVNGVHSCRGIEGVTDALNRQSETWPRTEPRVSSRPETEHAVVNLGRGLASHTCPAPSGPEAEAKTEPVPKFGSFTRLIGEEIHAVNLAQHQPQQLSHIGSPESSHIVL